ncbi:hypothetical protein EIP91_011479, partial [Steccherinum ochraceum]
MASPATTTLEHCKKEHISQSDADDLPPPHDASNPPENAFDASTVPGSSHAPGERGLPSLPEQTDAPFPDLLPPILVDELYPIPHTHTVVEHDGVSLLSYYFTIDTNLCAAVCRECSKFIVPPSNIPRHVATHARHAILPETLVPQLVESYNLQDEPQYPVSPIRPVYGLPLHPTSKYFCREPTCHRGYSSTQSLQAHQSSVGHVGVRCYVSYAQQAPTAHRRFFPVLLHEVPSMDDLAFDFSAAFTEEITRLSDEPATVYLPDDKMGYLSFFRSEGWLSLLEAFNMVELAEAHRSHRKILDPADPAWALEHHGELLRSLALKFLANAQVHIREHVTYG